MLLSFNLKVIIGYILALNPVLRYVDQADNSTGWCITEASKSDATLDKFFSLMASHVLLEVGIDITPDEGTARATECPAPRFDVTRWVDLVDLIALVGVPATADHGSWEAILVGVDYFTHHCRCWLNRWQISELWSLDIHVIANIASNGTSVRWSTRALAVDALVDRLQLVWDTITDIHVLRTKKNQSSWNAEREFG